MKQAIKLDVRIDIEDDVIKVRVCSGYLPVHLPYLVAIQNSVRQLSREQFKELFDSKDRVVSVEDKQEQLPPNSMGD